MGIVKNVNKKVIESTLFFIKWKLITTIFKSHYTLQLERRFYH